MPRSEYGVTVFEAWKTLISAAAEQTFKIISRTSSSGASSFTFQTQPVKKEEYLQRTRPFFENLKDQAGRNKWNASLMVAEDDNRYIDGLSAFNGSNKVIITASFSGEDSLTVGICLGH